MVNKIELRKDYENASYDRKNLANKYNTPAKGKDIQSKILSILKDIRNTQTEFDFDDMRDWFRTDPKETKLNDYLNGEPIKFVEMLQNYYNEAANKYGNSPAGKYNHKMHDNITAWLAEVTKTDEQKKIEEDIYVKINKLVDKINVEINDFKEKYIEDVKKFATSRYNEFPIDIDNLKNKIKKIEEDRNIWNYNNYELRKLTNKLETINGILKLYPTIDEYVNKCVKEAIEHFNYTVRNLAERLINKNFVIDNISITNVHNDPKFFVMTISDGIKTLFCRSILAANNSTKMIPHFRFIMTER
jgi:hypothetical protein